MFEAVVTVCLMMEPDICRDVLLPNHRAAEQADCLASLSTVPDYVPPSGLTATLLTCKPEGPALEVSEVGEGVFWHRGLIEEPDRVNRGDVTNLGFVIGEDWVAVIDTGTARWMGEALLRAIRQRTDLPIGFVILTHMHPDHVLGANVLAEAGGEVVGHAKLPRALADRRDNYLESLSGLLGDTAFIGSDIIAPSVVVEDEMVLALGGRHLTLRSWPAAHTGTDLTVQDDLTGLLFTGDLVFHEHTPALDGSLRGWQKVLAEFADLNPTGILPGHGGPLLDWPGGTADMERYLEVLAHDTRQAIDDGMHMGEAVTQIAESERDHWTLFDAYNPRNATVAFTELEWE